jgi:hypothetical protein
MKKILLMTGSINQTMQMTQIARHLPEYDCWFSQIFTDSPLIDFLIKYTDLSENMITGRQFRQKAEEYLRDNSFNIDYKAELNRYDLVIYCSDMLIPIRMQHQKLVWVQEGMTDPKTWKSTLIKKLKLPTYWCGDTSLNGASNICDIYCAASEGYKRHFTEGGTEADKIYVTGIPNYDNLQQHLNNDFKHRGYVMVATSDIRETYRKENRIDFIKNCVKIADGRRLLFKLHPNENIERAVAEIKAHTPENTLIYWGGNTNDMIANCSELITQYSTVVYVGIALGKKIYSYFDIDTLKSLCPIQNDGVSARNIAGLCRAFVEFKGKKEDFKKYFTYKPESNNKSALSTEGVLFN